jgi:hypothetical protein
LCVPRGFTGSSELLEKMAGTTRLELATSAVTGQRSNQLNYVPALLNTRAKTALADNRFSLRMQAVLVSGPEAGQVDNLDVKWWPDWRQIATVTPLALASATCVRTANHPRWASLRRLNG